MTIYCHLFFARVHFTLVLHYIDLSGVYWVREAMCNILRKEVYKYDQSLLWNCIVYASHFALTYIGYGIFVAVLPTLPVLFPHSGICIASFCFRLALAGQTCFALLKFSLFSFPSFILSNFLLPGKRKNHMKIANLRNEVQNSNGNWNGNDRVEFSLVFALSSQFRTPFAFVFSFNLVSFLS